MGDFDELAEKIRDRECALFLGAGCSMGSKAPSGQRLLDAVRSQFHIESKLCTELQTAFDIACGPDEENRTQVESFLQDIFTRLRPNSGHKIMTGFKWPAIFTTNYDQLIETAYMSPDAVQTLNPVCREVGASIELNNSNVVPLFKLFGCISSVTAFPSPSHVPLVLTSKDYIQFKGERVWMLEALEKLARVGTWLIIGYGFDDGLLRNLFMDLRASAAWKYQPKCYVVLPDVTKDDEEYLRIYKLKLISDTFEGLMEKLDRKYSAEARRILYATTVSNNPAIMGKQVGEIEPRLRLDMDQQFVIVDDELIERDNGELLFKGYPPTWGDIARGYDIQRKEFTTIKDVITNDLTAEVQEAKFYVLASATGAGKSTLLKRIGYDFYRQGVLVIMLRPHACTQWKMETIEKLYQHFGRRILALVDDAHICYPQAFGLFNKLRTRGVPITMLVALRKGDYNLVGKREPLADVQPDFTLSDTIEDESEFRQLLFALEQRGFIKFDLGRDVHYWLDHFRETANGVILVVMLEATRRKRFEEIVIEEYDSLAGSIAQPAYANICALHQYDIPLKQHMLRSTLQCDWVELLREIRKGIAELTIIETGGVSVEPFYESRHRLIAKKVADSVFSTRTSLTDAIEKVIAAAFPHEITDERTVLDILRNDALLDDIGEVSLKRRLFDKASERFPSSDTILLHYGRMLSQEGEYEPAEDILQRAHTIDPKNLAIIHYLGILYRDKARNTTRRGDLLRQKLYRDAESQFEIARRADPQNEFAYHSHAEMLLDMKRYEHGSDEEMDQWLNKAFSITSEGLRLVPRQNRRLIEDVHNAILGELGNIEAARTYFKSRTDAGAGPDTWCLWARTELESQNIDESLDIVRRALTKYPEHMGVILIAGDIAEAFMNKRGIVNEEGLSYMCTSSEKLFERSDIRLRYAVALFQANKKGDAANEFQKAHRLLPESIPATSIYYYWNDENGQRKRFRGQAIRREKIWEVKSDIGPAHINPRQVELRGIKPGQDIQFVVGFNYIGPIALLD